MAKQRRRLWGTDGHEGFFYRFTAALFGPAPTGPYGPPTASSRRALGSLRRRNVTDDQGPDTDQ